MGIDSVIVIIHDRGHGKVGWIASSMPPMRPFLVEKDDRETAQAVPQVPLSILGQREAEVEVAMYRTCSIRLRPNAAQRQTLDTWLYRLRELYNMALEQRRDAALNILALGSSAVGQPARA